MSSPVHPLRRLARRLVRHRPRCWPAALAVALAGCQQMARLPAVEVALPSAALPLPADPPPAAARPAPGAIYSVATYRPLFESHRARMVGDTLQVQIQETLSATQTATSSVERKGSVNAGVTALPLLKGSALTRASATGSGNTAHEGSGSTQASNDFKGVVTATVVQVLPNGHLLVSAEKQIGVNANVDVLRFSGQVDPRFIAPGNSVLSTQIANVRVEQRGRGQQAEAQSMGWLSRFFLSVMPI